MIEKQIIDYVVLTFLCIVSVGASFALYQNGAGTISPDGEGARLITYIRNKPMLPDSSAIAMRALRQNRRKPPALEPPPVIVSPSPTPVVLPPPLRAATEVMAWLYPGAPACLASTEISDGRKINVLKAEYFTVTDTGALTLLPEAVAGCNGYSEKNIALLKQFSTSQYVTVSANFAGAMELFLKGNTSEAVNTLVSFTTTHQLTGVELDYEDFGSWSGEQYTLYKEFVTLLGEELHAHGKKLIIDGPAISSSVEEGWFVWRYQDFTALPVDQIVVMAYDHQYDEGVGSAISPFAWMENVISWTLKKYPDKSKIVVGLPSYGYRGVEGTQKVIIETHEQIAKENGFSTATRDPLSGEMTWLTGTTRFFYQDGESLRQKQVLVEKLGIPSISIWHLGGNLWF